MCDGRGDVWGVGGRVVDEVPAEVRDFVEVGEEHDGMPYASVDVRVLVDVVAVAEPVAGGLRRPGA